MKQLFEEFRNFIIVEYGLSDNTYESYAGDLHKFLGFLNKKTKDSNQSLMSASYCDITEFLSDLRSLNMSSSTISRTIVSIRRFYNFLLFKGLISENPASEVSYSSFENSEKKSLSKSEIKMLFEAAFEDASENRLRNILILDILYSTGMRVSELIQLKISDVLGSRNQINKYFYICGKNKKERVVILSDSALINLEKYLEFRLIEIGKISSNSTNISEKCQWLFPGRTYQCGKLGVRFRHISRQRVFQVLKKIAVNAKLDCEDIYPHVIRHSFATHLLNNGIDYRVLQELLGHSDISSTQRYTGTDINELIEALEKHHPLSNLKKPLSST